MQGNKGHAACCRLYSPVQKTPPPLKDNVPGKHAASLHQDYCMQGSRPRQHTSSCTDTVLGNSDVFEDIFNISPRQAVVPMCLKTVTIIPVPKTFAQYERLLQS
ncbi:hypothetical protein GOODEAATRI_030071 [Goodea atripinnis]|uniref:Uncharacterized protein n=1 Tax=Goodea atripinnis TaxID=208336 RepID=A0ABV0NZ02_9TELE